jgi:hypothetical protein
LACKVDLLDSLIHTTRDSFHKSLLRTLTSTVTFLLPLLGIGFQPSDPRDKASGRPQHKTPYLLLYLVVEFVAEKHVVTQAIV